MYNDHLLCNQWALWGEWYECVRPLSLCVRGCKSLYIYNREMSTPLWGEREPLARARGDRRAQGHCTTLSPLFIGGGVVGWGGGVVDRLQSLIFQRSYAMVPHRVPRFLLYIAMDKFDPGTVSAYMQAYWRRIGAACFFRIVPGAVCGILLQWKVSGIWCIMVLARSHRCGVFPGCVPCGLLSFTVLLHSICPRWYSSRFPAILFL